MVAKSLIDALANFDANAVIGKALASAAPKLVTLVGDQVKRTPDRIAAALGTGFSSHLETTFEKCYKIKTLIYREDPIELLSQYVPIKLGRSRSKVTDNYLIENLEVFKNVIIQGSGGSGKTMFMKYLSLCRFENPKGRIPIFIELRTLTYDNTKSLEQLIFEDSTAKRSRLSFEQFEKGLAAGLFMIILDGLDEVDPAYRESVHRQIIKFPIKYPDNILVISSREDQSLLGWNQFHNYNVLPLDKRQVTAVIKKIDFDKTIKAKFLKDLSNSLYDKHKSFLTNPLLATIMLLRYDQFADAGDKIYIFYDQAFETLFFKHDLSKGVYERKRYTSISVDDFKKFFAVFCFATYANNRYAFSRADIIGHIDRALKYSSLVAANAAVLKDLIESICIIQEDGLQFTFVHRSFQEYFSALFVSDYRGDKATEYVNIIMEKNSTETAGVILKEMSPRLVDKLWGLPKMLEVSEEFEKIDFVKDPGKIIQEVFGRLYIEKDGRVEGFGIETLGTDLIRLNKHYRYNTAGFFSTYLLVNPKESLSTIRSKLPDFEKNKFQERLSKLISGNEGMMSGKIDSSDNYWLIYTNVSSIFTEVLGNLVIGLNALRSHVASFQEADESLIIM